MSAPGPALPSVFGTWGNVVTHVANSFPGLLTIWASTIGAAAASIGWFGYFLTAFWAILGLAWVVVSAAVGAGLAALLTMWLTYISVMLSLAVLFLSLCGGPLLGIAALLVLLAAVFLLKIAELFATFVERFWPNLAERVGLVRVRRFCNDLFTSGSGLGNP